MRDKKLTFILAVIALLITGITLLNSVCDESWKLLLIDIKTGFTDAKRYLKLLILFIVVLLIISIYLWQSLFGSMHLEWIFKVKSKTFAYTNGEIIRNNTLIVDLLCMTAIGVSLYMNCRQTLAGERIDLWDNAVTIGHSFGKINDDYYMGSLEAFTENYKLGQRSFEADIILTSDDKAVLKHDWNYPPQDGISEENVPNEEMFLNTKLNGEYTPLSFAQVCELMAEYPDVWLITDTKYTEPDIVKKQFDILVETAANTGGGHEGVLNRIVVQVYNEEMYAVIEDYQIFQSYIFTMYQRWQEDDTQDLTEVSRFCVNNGIRNVAMSNNIYDYNEELQTIVDRYGINLYLHTINEIKQAEKYLENGVAGIYTDEIQPPQLGEIR